MTNIVDLLICPKCKIGLDESLKCYGCNTEYSYVNGVYDIISKELSDDQEILWDITDEMIDRDIELRSEREDSIKEYNSYKNEDTIEAQKFHGEAMDKEIEKFSGLVCDLATGMGSMLERLLDSKNKDFEIVCTDVDKRILMATKKVKDTDDRVTYVGTDGRYLSIVDDSFDYATSLGGLSNIEYTDLLVKELYRVLKPGGKLVIQCSYVDKDSESYNLAKGRGLEKGLIEDYLIEELDKAGFVNIESNIVSKAIWSENPYDLLPAAGDMQYNAILIAEK